MKGGLTGQVHFCFETSSFLSIRLNILSRARLRAWPLTASVRMHGVHRCNGGRKAVSSSLPASYTSTAFLGLPKPPILDEGLAMGGLGHDGSQDGYYIAVLLKDIINNKRYKTPFSFLMKKITT